MQDKILDYNITFVCFNIQTWVGNSFCIPSGPLREDLKSIEKYDAVFLNGNDENTIIIKNSSTHGNKLSLFFEEMWNSIPGSWLKKDPLPESLVSGTSCYDSIDNDFDNIIDSNEKECLM